MAFTVGIRPYVAVGAGEGVQGGLRLWVGMAGCCKEKWMCMGLWARRDRKPWAQSGTGSVTHHLPSQGRGGLPAEPAAHVPGLGPRSRWRNGGAAGWSLPEPAVGTCGPGRCVSHNSTQS